MPEEVDPHLPDSAVLKLAVQLEDLRETAWIGIRLGLTRSQAEQIRVKAAKIANTLEKHTKEGP